MMLGDPTGRPWRRRIRCELLRLGELRVTGVVRAAGVAGVAGLALAGCGSSLLGVTSTTPPPPASTSAAATSATTTPLNGEVAVAFPVVTCTTSVGVTSVGVTSASTSTTNTSTTTKSTVPSGGQGWNPTILLAPIPTALVGKVEFYSDGAHTLLGPVGWICSVVQANQGAAGMAVYPPGNPNPPVDGSPPAGTEGVFAAFDSTGRAQGVARVCPFFAVAAWQLQVAHCSGTKPTGEEATMPTPDIASVTDPAGVIGSLESSGGVEPVTGAVIFPQVASAVSYGTAVNIAEVSCSLVDAALCATILSDFEVREFPVPTPVGR